MENALSILTQLMTQLYQHLLAGRLGKQFAKGLSIGLHVESEMLEHFLEAPSGAGGGAVLGLDRLADDLLLSGLGRIDILHRRQDLELESEKVSLLLAALAGLARSVNETVVSAHGIGLWGLDLAGGKIEDFFKGCHG